MVDTDATKEELYDQAQDLDVPGRSSMDKEELAEAVEEAQDENAPENNPVEALANWRDGSYDAPAS